LKFHYSKTSKRRLYTCEFDIQQVMREALAMGIIDITIVCGQRGKAKQDEYYYGRPQRSRVPYPKSKHNKEPLSDAVDAAPYVNGKLSRNFNHCCVLAGVVLACAKKLGIPIRWGGNWDMDGEPITDQDFQDLYHYERVK